MYEGAVWYVRSSPADQIRGGGEADIFPQRVELHAPDWENGWRKDVRESTAIIENFPQHTHKHIHI